MALTGVGGVYCGVRCDERWGGWGGGTRNEAARRAAPLNLKFQ